MRDSIFVKEQISFSDLDHILWSGAKQRWDDATDDQKERVWNSLMESVNVQMDSTGDIPTKTEVNDFIWFECDDIFDEDESKESYRRCRRGSRTESLRDPVEPEIAKELREYAINNPKGYRLVKNIVMALSKKASRGVDLNKDRLKDSSMMASLVRDVIRGYEEDFYPRGEKMDISTATRNLLKQKLAEDILELVES